jgi:hypothetical protein
MVECPPLFSYAVFQYTHLKDVARAQRTVAHALRLDPRREKHAYYEQMYLLRAAKVQCENVTVLCTYAVVRSLLHDDYDTAEVYLQQALDMAVRATGPDAASTHVEVLRIMSDVSMARRLRTGAVETLQRGWRCACARRQTDARRRVEEISSAASEAFTEPGKHGKGGGRQDVLVVARHAAALHFLRHDSNSARKVLKAVGTAMLTAAMPAGARDAESGGGSSSGGGGGSGYPLTKKSGKKSSRKLSVAAASAVTRRMAVSPSVSSPAPRGEKIICPVAMYRCVLALSLLGSPGLTPKQLGHCQMLADKQIVAGRSLPGWRQAVQLVWRDFVSVSLERWTGTRGHALALCHRGLWLEWCAEEYGSAEKNYLEAKLMAPLDNLVHFCHTTLLNSGRSGRTLPEDQERTIALHNRLTKRRWRAAKKAGDSPDKRSPSPKKRGRGGAEYMRKSETLATFHKQQSRRFRDPMGGEKEGGGGGKGGEVVEERQQGKGGGGGGGGA